VNKHLSDHQLISYLDAQRETGKQDHLERVEAHILACSTCRVRLERLTRTAALLTSTLQAAGDQVPLHPERSWHRVKHKLEKRRVRKSAPALHLLLRYGAIFALLALTAGSIAGLIHTLAVTGPDQVSTTPTPGPAFPPTASSSSAPPGPLPRQQSYQTNVPLSLLILGSDGESADSDEIDALMLLHLVRREDSARYALLISIPRNLYLDLPGGGQATAGSLYRLGEEEAGNGLVFTGQAISATLGVSVERVVLLHFEGFIKLIDLIGGVEIDVPYQIDDPDFPDGHGGSEPLFIPAGRHLFDGAAALRYARTTVIPEAGFDRTFRQQQIALAVYRRVTQPGVLAGLIARAPALWSSVSNDLETDLSLSEAIDLALVMNNLTTEEIVTVSIEECCTVPYTAPGTGRVLLIQEERLEELLQAVDVNGDE
jgi:LCP family protein required for cell wall assembly